MNVELVDKMTQVLQLFLLQAFIYCPVGLTLYVLGDVSALTSRSCSFVGRW